MNNNRNQRFKLICAAADRIVEETGVSPSEVSGYAVSKTAFGKKPNGDFYILFEEWLKLRQAVPGAPPADMPAEAAAALEQWADHLKAQIMQRVTGIVREVAGSFEQTTALRVGALERLNADQVRRGQAVIATLIETEAELGEEQARVASLTDELKQEREQVQRLLGRLEERDNLLKALRPEAAAHCGAPVSPATLDNKAALRGGSGDVSLPLTRDFSDTAQPVVPNEQPDQPSAIETGHSPDGQVEMPLVTSVGTDRTIDGGDDHG